MRSLRTTFPFLILFTLILTGCNATFTTPTTQNDDPFTSIGNSSSINDVIKAQNLVAYVNGDSLFIVDPNFADPVQVYTLKESEKLAAYNLRTFHFSPDNKWLSWYSPNEGVLVLNLINQTLEIVHPPSTFLNTSPFLEFVSDENLLLFITQDGNVLQKVNVENLEQTSTSIPFPYGNMFQVSPDKESILFISGYAQSDEFPKFMYTDFQGNFTHQFESSSEISNRKWVAWHPNSTGIFAIEDNEVLFYSLVNPDQPKTVFRLTIPGKITSLYRINHFLFASADNGYWHVLDLRSEKEVARTPVAIANEMNSPEFFPWTEDNFLIEDTIYDGDLRFNRLWISDFRGVKKLVVDRYNEAIIKTDTPILN